MKNLLFWFGILLASTTAVSQNFSVTNSTPYSMTVRIHAIGTNGGYNTCENMMYTDIVVGTNFIETVFGFDGVWFYENGTMVSNPLLAGTAKWVRAEYYYFCGVQILGKFTTSICGGSPNLVTASGCNVHGVWQPNNNNGNVLVKLY